MYKKSPLMATLAEMDTTLRGISDDKQDEKIELCFEIMELFCNIQEKARTIGDLKICCRAAVVLSGIVKKGLGGRTQVFLQQHEKEKPLPDRAEEILRNAILRMESY